MGRHEVPDEILDSCSRTSGLLLQGVQHLGLLLILCGELPYVILLAFHAIEFLRLVLEAGHLHLDGINLSAEHACEASTTFQTLVELFLVESHTSLKVGTNALLDTSRFALYIFQVIEERSVCLAHFGGFFLYTRAVGI